MAEESYKITVLLPLSDNQGEPFDAQTWLWWHHRLRALVRGFTDLGVVIGWWEGYSDQNRHLTIVVETTHEVEQIRELLGEARIRFRQEAMYFEYHLIHFEEIR
jgi:hypothetical protein